MTLLKERIGQCDFRGTSKNELENADAAITELLNYARRKEEGRKRHLPCSKEKSTRWSELNYWKLRKKQLLNQTVNEESTNNKKKAANIVDCTTTIEEVIIKRDIAQLNWNEMKEKAKEIRNQYLSDCRDMQITGDEVTNNKRKEKINKRAKKDKRSQWSFKCIANNADRGKNNSSNNCKSKIKTTTNATHIMIELKWKAK